MYEIFNVYFQLPFFREYFFLFIDFMIRILSCHYAVIFSQTVIDGGVTNATHPH